MPTTTTLLSEQEYARMSFEAPEPDYVEGALIERALPTTTHSRVQKKIFKALMPWDDLGTLFAHAEIRLCVAPSKYRVADIAYFTSEPSAEIPEHPPYAVVEIVSPDDRHDEIMAKLRDYEGAGIAFIFLADPPLHRLSLYREGSLLAVPALEMPEFGVKVPVDIIFA